MMVMMVMMVIMTMMVVMMVMIGDASSSMSMLGTDLLLVPSCRRIFEQ